MTDRSDDSRAFHDLSAAALTLLGTTRPPRDDGTIALRLKGGVTLMVLEIEAGKTAVVVAECETLDVGTHAAGVLACNFAVADGGPLFAINPSTGRIAVLRTLGLAHAAARDVTDTIDSVLEAAFAFVDVAAAPPAADDGTPHHEAIGRMA